MKTFNFKLQLLTSKGFQAGFIKLTKKTLVLLLAVSILLPSFSYLLLFKLPKPAKAEWYDDNWTYRTSYSNNNTGSAVTNQKIKLDIDTQTLINNSKLQADCDDSRFTDQNGNILKYYLDSAGGACNTISTDYYVLVPTINAGRTIIYHYYGNPQAQNGTEAAQFTEATFSPASSTAASEEKGPGPVAYWKFDDGQGQTTQDSTTNNNDGTISGATWQTEDLCISGKCLYFDGSNDVVTVSNTVSGIQTVSFWVRPQTTSEQFIDLNGSAYIQSSSGTISATGFTSPTIYVNGKVSSTITANSWQYVTATTGTALSGSAIKIGQISTNYGQGFIDDVKIYNYARSLAQIQADYNSRGASKGTAAQLGSRSNVGDRALSDGLVALWKMDEASANSCSGGVNDNCDSSGNSNDGAWNGDATSAAGKFGNGTTFDGTGDYVNAGSPSILDNLNTFTISAWIKPNVTTLQYFVTKNGEVGSGGWGFGLGASVCSGNAPFIYKIDNPSTVVCGNATITTGNWYHAVVTYNGSTATVYVNGITGTAGSITFGSDASYNLLIGERSVNSYPFSGQIDDVRIYNRALSPKEVEALYNFAPGPVGYWDFEDSSGSTAADKSGNGNNGTVTIGASGTQTSTSQAWTAGTPGKIGSALNFDGSDDYVSVTNPSSGILSVTGPITISAWIKSTDYSDHRSIIAKGSADCTNTCPYDVYLLNNNGLPRLVRGNASTFFITQGATAPTAGQWSYISITDNGSAVTMYLNGVPMTTTIVQGSYLTPTADSSNIRIGLRADSGTKMYGVLDDVRIYNYARTQKQVIEDMAGGHPGVSAGGGGDPSQGSGRVAGAVAHYKFDEGYGTTANNTGYGGSTLNGTLSAASWTNNGKFGKAWDGTGARWVSKADDANFDFAAADDLAISLWFKSDSATNPTATEYLFNKASATIAGYAVYVNTSGQVCFGIDDDTTWTPDDTACTTSDIYDATWHHIVASKTGTSRIDLYVDGKSTAADTSIAATATLENSLTMYVGDRDGTDNGDEFNGDLDEVKVYRGVLTSSEVGVEYNRGSATVLGALGDNTSYDKQAANQEYCIPGDTSTCTAPVGRWDFEESQGQTAYDTSGNANNGTLGANSSAGSDDPTWAVGRKAVGAGLSFDGGDYVDAGTGSSLNVTTALTLEAWVKISGSTGTHQFIIGRDNGGAQRSWVWGVDGSYKPFFSSIGVADRISNNSSSATLAAGVWYHMALTYDGTNYKEYTNGVLGATVAGSASISSSANTIIGSRDGTLNFWKGSIDDVRIYNYARSAAQIAWDYNRGAPVGWWKMDEGQGGTLYDSSGNGNNGTWNGASAGTQTAAGDINTSGTAWFNGKTGKRNYSLNFDGVDDYVSIATSALGSIGPTSSLSLSAWVKAASLPSTLKRVISNQTILNDFEITMSISPGNKWGATIGKAGVAAQDTLDSTVLTADNWYYLVAVYNGNSVTLYVNGQSKATTSANSTTNGASSTNRGWTIANERYGTSSPDTSYYFFPGQIDDVRIYNYALTGTQVKLLMNEGAVRFGPSSGTP